MPRGGIGKRLESILQKMAEGEIQEQATIEDVSTLDHWALGDHDKDKYGWLGVYIPDDIAAKMQGWAKAKIPSDRLVPSQDDSKPHVTVLYPVTVDDVTFVQKVIPDGLSRPLYVRFNEVEIFKRNPEYDVVIIRVTSSDLELMHELFHDDLCRGYDTYTEYIPHATLAYVKKDSCNHLEWDPTFQNDSFEARAVHYKPSPLSAPVVATQCDDRAERPAVPEITRIDEVVQKAAAMASMALIPGRETAMSPEGDFGRIKVALRAIEAMGNQEQHQLVLSGLMDAFAKMADEMSKVALSRLDLKQWASQIDPEDACVICNAVRDAVDSDPNLLRVPGIADIYADNLGCSMSTDDEEAEGYPLLEEILEEKTGSVLGGVRKTIRRSAIDNPILTALALLSGGYLGGRLASEATRPRGQRSMGGPLRGSMRKRAAALSPMTMGSVPANSTDTISLLDRLISLRPGSLYGSFLERISSPESIGSFSYDPDWETPIDVRGPSYTAYPALGPAHLTGLRESLGRSRPEESNKPERQSKEQKKTSALMSIYLRRKQ